MHCRICAGAECDTEIRLCQRSRVIHAVTDHGHLMPILLQPDHLGDLLLGQHVGDHLINADPGRDCSSRCFMITG
jgi:hypothetical protein